MKHMNKGFCAFAAVVLVAAVPAYGQIIEEDDGYNRDTTEKFFGKANAVFVNGSSYRVFRQSVELGYDTSFDEENGRVYFTGVASHNDLELDLERTAGHNEPPNALQTAPPTLCRTPNRMKSPGRWMRATLMSKTLSCSTTRWTIFS